MVKIVNNRLEEARVSIRNVRRDSLKELRDYEKEKMISEDEMHKGEEDLQELTNNMIDQIAVIGKSKEEEIMEF